MNDASSSDINGCTIVQLPYCFCFVVRYPHRNYQSGGERGEASAYPYPTTGAVLIAKDGSVLGSGRSDYDTDSVQAVLKNSGLEVTPLKEWCITWPSSTKLRNDLASATLYLTLEPTMRRRGQRIPPITQLIELSGIKRVVIGCRYVLNVFTNLSFLLADRCKTVPAK